ncbi:LPXTG cell wall anchor domain-containing protein [Isoptericola sp. NPDC057391]|uniref:LPXTG cell wall anchor domain-containing protein n=1 Tax=Isoptericola sp. NPDC057391 TaxID=3346117 RepID=UPI00363458BC
MRHATVAATAAALLLISAGPAAAGGSDDEPPYRVTADGLTLPAGDAFRDGGHVNIRYTTPGAGQQGAGIHFETLNQRPSGAYVGKQFLPWSALVGAVPAGLCITWVQVEGYNEHFGEGGQEPVCTPASVPVPEPSATPERSEPPATEATTPATPDSEAPGPEASTPAAPPQEGVTEEPAVPGSETETEGETETPAGSDGDTRPAPEDEPATPRPEASAASDDVVGGALPAADAPEQAIALSGDVDGATAAVEQLPRTGAEVAALVVAAAVLLGGGAALLLVRRRRRA